MITLRLYKDQRTNLQMHGGDEETKKIETFLNDHGATFTSLSYVDDPLAFDELRALPCLELRNDADEPITQVFGFKPNRILPMIQTQLAGGQVSNDD